MSRFKVDRSRSRGLNPILVVTGGVLASLSVLMAGCEDRPGTSLRPTGATPAVPDGGSAGDILSSTAIDEVAAGRVLGLLQAGAFEAAEAAATTRLEVDPDDARTRFLLGVARQKQKRYAAGLAAIDEACASSISFPERPHAGHFRGWCLFYLGRPEDAADAFEAHLLVSPEEADSHFGLGVSLLESGRPVMARTSFERAIELNDGREERRRDLAKAWIRLGDTWWETDRPEEARAAYHKGVIRYPDHYEGWEKLARALDRAGDATRAERARNEARNARRRVGAFVEDADADRSAE